MDKLRRKYGFTLVEVLIVVALLGILAAIVIPLYENNTQKAKESAAKEDLRVLRNAIELYATQHNGMPPGFQNLNGSITTAPGGQYIIAFQLIKATDKAGKVAEVGTSGYPLGPYLNNIPLNQFKNSRTIKVIADGDEFPNEPTDESFGWTYKPLTKKLKINQTGTDSGGTAYFDY